MNALTQASKARPTAAEKASGSKLDGSSLEAVDVEELFKVGLHALTLLGHANYELSLRRREKDDLAAALCGPDIPVTKFGDEFSKSLKEAKQVARMGRDYGGGQCQGPIPMTNTTSQKTTVAEVGSGQGCGNLNIHKINPNTKKGRGQIGWKKS